MFLVIDNLKQSASLYLYISISSFQFQTLSLLSPDLQPLVDDAILNRNRWEELSKEVAKGHINPELEPVLKPFTSQENQATYL